MFLCVFIRTKRERSVSLNYKKPQYSFHKDA